ncbi:MAG TPA: hypothetical protein VGG48_12495 [Rhizomicrobium sp.]|jgi:hypothetical protein
MKITFDFDPSPEDLAILAVALNCTEAEVVARLPGHARAALVEYVEAYLGRRAFSRGSDILEHRLSLLIEHAYGNRLLGEAEVSRLFQTTLPASRSLLRSVLSKYRFQLQTAATGTAKAALEVAKWKKDDNEYVIEVKAANLVEILNQRLAADFGGQKPIGPAKDSIATYLIAPGSYDSLCMAFGAKPVPRQ